MRESGDDDGPERVTLILRPDVEDRLCHDKTSAWDASYQETGEGFAFPADLSRRLYVSAPDAQFTGEPEWLEVHHPIDAERGFGDRSDLFSPGYFAAPLARGSAVLLHAGTNPPEGIRGLEDAGGAEVGTTLCGALTAALDAFIVRRERALSVIAGYPWFLDWGRDTLIFLRGLIAAGRLDDTARILTTFARFEDRGTLPNMIRGGDASDRDTSDAPLWFMVACADLHSADRAFADRFFASDCRGRPMLEILSSIVRSYIVGTPNGICMDPESALIYSPPHFTWMDTNHPPGTPRTGYPIEIQALWHAALRFRHTLQPEGGVGGEWQRGCENRSRNASCSGRARATCRIASTRKRGGSVAQGVADDHLRPNQLFAVTLGAVADAALAAEIVLACEELLVPGAIRTLADRPVFPCPPLRMGGASSERPPATLSRPLRRG